MAVLLFYRSCLLMTEARYPHGDNKDRHADNTELSELIAAQEVQEGQFRKRYKPWISIRSARR